MIKRRTGFSSVETDLHRIADALRWGTAFRNWLSDANESVALGQCGLSERIIDSTFNGKRAMIIVFDMDAHALDSGFPDNLRMGLFWDPGKVLNARGICVRPDFPDHQSSLCLLRVPQYPRDMTDAAWGLDWSIMTHEISHHLDDVDGDFESMRRSYLEARAKGIEWRHPTISPHDQVSDTNSSSEVTAYFRQVIGEELQALASESASEKSNSSVAGRLRDRDAFWTSVHDRLPSTFRALATQSTMEAFEARAEAMRGHLAAAWPNVAIVQEMAARLRARWHRLEMADAASATDIFAPTASPAL